MPLPDYLSSLRLPASLPPPLAFERISALCPVSVSVRARFPAPFHGGDWAARSSAEQEPLPEVADIERILRAADGTIPVATLARDFGVRSPEEQATFLQSLRYLWRHGALTWLTLDRHASRRRRSKGAE
jgi:hypothetical protein